MRGSSVTPASRTFARQSDRAAFQLLDPLTRDASYVDWDDLRLHWLPRLTTAEGVALLDDKDRFHRAAVEGGLPVPDLVAVVHGDDDPAALHARLARVAPASVVVKPANGRKGRGVVVFVSIDADGKAGTTIRGRHRRIDSAVRQSADAGLDARVVVQQGLRQHHALDVYAPQPLSTVRIHTLLRRDGSVRLIAPYLKLGRAGAMTDNWSRGGVLMPIDLATGALGQGFVANGDLLVPVDSHPDTGVRVVGHRLPHWQALLDTATRAGKLFPSARLVGWDVMVTDDGPRVIEGNWDVRFHVIQATRGTGLLDDSLRADLVELGVAARRR